MAAIACSKPLVIRGCRGQGPTTVAHRGNGARARRPRIAVFTSFDDTIAAHGRGCSRGDAARPQSCRSKHRGHQHTPPLPRMHTSRQVQVRLARRRRLRRTRDEERGSRNHRARVPPLAPSPRPSLVRDVDARSRPRRERDAIWRAHHWPAFPGWTSRPISHGTQN